MCAGGGGALLGLRGRGGRSLDERDLLLLGLIDEQYTQRPFYGSRWMVVFLREQGHPVNRKRVLRLIGVLGLAGMAPGPATSKPHPEHNIYPYLLRGVAVTRFSVVSIGGSRRGCR